MLRKITLLMLAGIFTLSNSSLVLASDNAPTRETAPEKYKWNTSAIYPDWDAWQNDLDKARVMLSHLVSYQGKLGEKPENLLEVLKTNDEASKILYKLYCYPYLQRSVETSNQEVNSRFQDVLAFFSEIGTQTSWITPELLTIPEPTLRSWITDIPGFGPYRFGIEDALRMQEFVLDEDKEKLVSYFSLSTSTPAQVYTELATTDIEFPEVTLSTGESIVASHAEYAKILNYSKNQQDRQLAWEGHISAFNKNASTYASLLNAVYQGDWAKARSKNFNSFLESQLIGNNIPVEVYHNLINTTKNNTKPLQHYLDLRRRALGLETYNSWDGLISLSEYSREYSWEEACELVFEALKPLGPDYQQRVTEMFSGGWIDVYESQSKESNPYSMSVYGVHPYILMNWNGTLNDVFTLAHEIGHALHSQYSDENQPFSTHNYSTFVAEVASIFNEELLLDHLLKKSNDPNEKIVLLNQAITNLVGTFYRQSLFADFEFQVRTMVENGQPVNLSSLQSLMNRLNEAYYGSSVKDHPYRDMTWSMVMHFYQLKYYVYQYATSYAASSHLFHNITAATESQQQQSLDRYIRMLKSGGSDYPVKLLQDAGVDMTQPETLEAVVQRLDDLVNQLEVELKAVNRI
ncbi:MAG: oligoendopeptidase F [Bacteroidales bacterium]|nr:oligoendopeptidase F [Bacteroidales bacterium]